jgi:uncharacterized GH25 family protein
MNMNKKIIFTILLIASGAFALAHEFWLLPKKFRFAVGEEMPVSLTVGENFEGELWDLKKHRVEKLELHQLTKSKDLRPSLKPEAKEKLKVRFLEEGTHLLAMQSDYAFIELGADKFNEYLKEDGLDNIYDQRKNTNTLDKPSKEFYGRFAKLLVQVGNKTDNTFKKRIGLKNEIVPEQNPYVLKTGDYLQCTVLYEGKPSPHQLVKVWNKIGSTTFLQNLYTENDGTVKFPINSKGPWMVSTVKMIASEKDGAEWQSMWASLVFGIE